MKCNICKKNEAVIHIEEFSQKGVRNLSLCLECAAEKGFNVRIEDIDNLLLNFLENIFGDSTNKFSKQIDENALKCPSCGKSIYEITETQKVGCPSCYSEFKKIIDLLIYKINNSMTYKGRLPQDLSMLRAQKARMEELKIKLNQYLLEEDYSNAAIVRDEMNVIKETYRKKRKKND
jgi:protein arginine kinase activator